MKHKLKLGLSVTTVLLMVPCYSYAQDDSMEEMVVKGKADKVEETKQSLLSSSTKLSGEQIEDLGLKDLRDTLRVQGNTYVAPSNNGNNGISIRGINSEGVGEPGGNSRPLVTVVIDGAPQSIEGVRRGQRGTWDLDEFDVTRGPQSTLQGRNTLAGSINITTKDPTDYPEYAVRLSAGDLDLFAPAIMASGPITDELSFRIAAEYSEAEKDIEYSDPYTEFLREDEYQNVRGKLLYKPESIIGLEMKFTVSHTTDDPAVMAVSGPEQGYDWRERFYDVSATSAEKRRNKIRNNIMDISYILENGAEITSTTAYVETDADLAGAGGNTGQAYERDELRADKDISQTFRYAHDPVDSDFSGQLGLFVGRFKNTRDSKVTLGGQYLQDLDAEREDINAAVFGELWWQFRQDWSLVTGLRLEVEQTEQSSENRYAGIQYNNDYDNNVALPKIGVLHNLNEIDTLAFTVSSGYRGGYIEIESIIGTIEEGGREVDPEYLTNLELAYRSAWLDNKLKFNASLFLNHWRDQQISLQVGCNDLESCDNESASIFTNTLNAGESQSYGVELDLAWRLTGATDVGVSLGFLKTEFIEFDERPTAVGNEFPEAPRASGGIWITSRFGQNWFVSADASGRTSAYATSDIFNDENKKIRSYAVANARGGYESDYFSAIVFVDNLFDRDYLIGRDRLGGYYVADALTLGVTLTARY